MPVFFSFVTASLWGDKITSRHFWIRTWELTRFEGAMHSETELTKTIGDTPSSVQRLFLLTVR